MNIGLYLAGSIASFVGLAFFFVMGFLSFFRKRVKKPRYDFLTDFPFEFYDGINQTSILSRFGFLVYQLAFIVIAFSGFSITAIPGLNAYIIFLLALFFIKGTSFVFLLFVPASNEKIHMVFALSSFILEAICSFVIGLVYFQFTSDSYAIFGWVFSVISWVLTAVNLSLVLNPRLANWTKMNVVEDMDGAHLEKPRPFILAFSEWIVILSDFLLLILLIVSLGFAFAL
ncbi:MAG: hypothetical protein II721_04705 [Bacilli bacterium]|nr:hypothetical protein [Bacilli bacterium]